MIIRAHVKANAKADSIAVAENNELHIRIRETPVEGKANKYLVGYLSKIFNVPKSCITILKGFNTSYKTITITAGDEQIKNILNALPHT